MSLLHTLALYIFHAIYALCEVLYLVKSRILQRHTNDTEVDTDDGSFLNRRGKVPNHVAVAFIRRPTIVRRYNDKMSAEQEEEYTENMLQDSRHATEWCSRLGIPNLTLYDRDG